MLAFEENKESWQERDFCANCEAGLLSELYNLRWYEVQRIFLKLKAIEFLRKKNEKV